MNAQRYSRIIRKRRFLLARFPHGLERHNYHLQLTDNYVEDARLRLRLIREPSTRKIEWILTQTVSIDSFRSHVTSLYLSEKEYEIFQVFEGQEIRKNRYPYQLEGRELSIDFFLGDLLGLILAIVNFQLDEDMESYGFPPFALKEVSENQCFSGPSLARSSFANIRELLKSGQI